MRAGCEMDTQYRCRDEARRRLVAAHPSLNGIDYLEVLDTDRPSGSLRQQTLLVHCFRELPTTFSGDNVRIAGGVREDFRINPVHVLWAFRAADVPVPPATQTEKDFFAALPNTERVLVVHTSSSGDFSQYRLCLVESPQKPEPPANFDPQLSEVDFSFKVECPTEFDCKPVTVCPPERPTEPLIDYLAKDYASFRRLMLDRLALIMPGWRERNPADLGIALVESLAYAADHLSYYQDAVATEAYLGTARRRVSVRRHARLLDYFIHDGRNARAWATIQVQLGSVADGAVLPGPSADFPGTQLLTTVKDLPIVLEQKDLLSAISAGAEAFEALHDITLRAAHNEIHFYTWGDENCCLPKGATRATLKQKNPDGPIQLAPGDVLIFEEVRGPQTGNPADADPAHRHAVRLTKVTPTVDPLFTEGDPPQPIPVVEIEWAFEDALRFPLCLWEVEDGEHPGRTHPVSVARSNVVLADHGRTILDEALDPILAQGRYRPTLRFGPLTHQGLVRDREKQQLVLFDPKAPASAALRREMRDVQPAIELREDGATGIRWRPQRDLLNSDRFASEFVVEMENDGRAHLRFGDGVLGREPADGLKVTYRIGNGRAGNVGAEALTHILVDPQRFPGANALRTAIKKVRNPLPAEGGTDPEPIDQVRLNAPQAFRTQERAVIEADYEAAAQRHPEVQRAAATLRWTGSWPTMFVTVDRKGGQPVDAAFEEELHVFLERFRLAGCDLEIDAPRLVSLDIALTVCVEPGYFHSDVKKVLLETFSNQELPDGRRGFFHPDNWSFGQPVYLSQVIAAAMKVPGVAWVKPIRFQRWGQDAHGELEDGRISFGRVEIARLDNDPSTPENGKFDFQMLGGL